MPNPTAHSKAVSGHILLVTWEHSDQAEIIVLLRQAGHQVDRIDNAAAALQALQHRYYDLVLLDIHPQESDSAEFVEQIRRLPIPLGLIPIIAVLSDSAPTSRYLAAGINAVLTLPLRQHQLLTLLAHWLPATETTPSADGKLLNLSILQELEMNTRPELLQRVVNIFIEETKNKLHRITTACRDSDWQSLQSEAHTLKSSAGTLGAQSLYTHVQQLDRACQSGDLNKVRCLVSSIGRVAIPTLDALSRRYLQ